MAAGSSEHPLDPPALPLDRARVDVAGRAAAIAALAQALAAQGADTAKLERDTELPLTHLKLDRSFVARLSADGASSLFITGLVELVHSLGLRIIAEGVETEPVAELLDELKVAWQQGFLHARPQPADALTDTWTAARQERDTTCPSPSGVRP